MPSDFVRDKDAVASCALMAEMVAWAKDQNKSIFQLIQDIYLEFGYSKEQGISVVRTGKSGADEIVAMMKNFRNNPPQEIAGSKVCTIKDYQLLIERDVQTGEKRELDFPATSNVLQYFTEDGTKVSVRPSGTEPKIKFYLEVRFTLPNRSDFAAIDAKTNLKIMDVIKSLRI